MGTELLKYINKSKKWILNQHFQAQILLNALSDMNSILRSIISELRKIFVLDKGQLTKYYQGSANVFQRRTRLYSYLSVALDTWGVNHFILSFYCPFLYSPQLAFTCSKRQWEHHNNVWNLFKVKNKDTRTTPMTSF